MQKTKTLKTQLFNKINDALTEVTTKKHYLAKSDLFFRNSKCDDSFVFGLVMPTRTFCQHLHIGTDSRNKSLLKADSYDLGINLLANYFQQVWEPLIERGEFPAQPEQEKKGIDMTWRKHAAEDLTYLMQVYRQLFNKSDEFKGLVNDGIDMSDFISSLAIVSDWVKHPENAEDKAETSKMLDQMRYYGPFYTLMFINTMPFIAGDNANVVDVWRGLMNVKGVAPRATKRDRHRYSKVVLSCDNPDNVKKFSQM